MCLAGLHVAMTMYINTEGLNSFKLIIRQGNDDIFSFSIGTELFGKTSCYKRVWNLEPILLAD